MYMGKQTVSKTPGVSCLVLLATLSAASAIPGLSEDQEKWLESVIYGNLSSDQQWPPLTVNQSGYLALNVQQYTAITETANYPWSQAVEVWYSDKNRTTPVLYDDVGDGAAWTGLHLASLVHEYLVTKNATVLEQLWQTLEAIDLLTSCTGKLGYIARFAGLATDPAYAAYYLKYGNGHYECVPPHPDYIWLGYSSRDMYHGISFGLTNAWVWMNHNDTVRNKVQLLVERIVDTLKKDDFWIISPNKKIVNPIPMHSANWRKLALSVNYNKYKDMESAYTADFWLSHTTSMDLSSKTANTYFPNELMVEGMYVLSLLEQDPSRKKALFDKFTEVVINHSDHLQPGYAAFYLSAFPNTTHSSTPRGILQGGLYDYPPAPSWDHMVDQSSNPKYLPHYDSEHSDYALMVRDRPPTTYLWQRAPTLLKGGEAACCFQRKHLDLILPYWMGRSSGFIDKPWSTTNQGDNY